ncbi:MAG: UDP-N-acetylmuramate dehydrogenase [Actinomycetia bacterium]|nr:UDP-N-acetylmuramate dehydrogenase [Actinomycetes bacterium]
MNIPALDLDAVAAACARAGLRVERDAPSAAFTTYRCGGPLAVLVRVGAVDDVRTLASTVDVQAVPVLVMGRGSNLLVADAGFRGIAVVLDGAFEGLELDRATGEVVAGSAVPLPVLARRSAAAGIGGLEFYVGIPGSVGGAVRMNAGGHGRDTAEVLISVRGVDLGSGTVEERTAADLELGYRHSNLSGTTVVLDARLAGRPDDPELCNARIAQIVQWRREHQPGGQNAGSVFTNPVGDAAGRLIEASGAKGARIGGAVVSEKHANFFVADDTATATDVYRLVRDVQRRVADATGVVLVPELQLIGFDDEAGDA